MKNKTAQKLTENAFRRKTGIKKTTFKEMVKILKIAEKEKKKQGGKPNKLDMEDRLLMWLEYMREYRTYFHIASEYGISESACWRNCIWIEDVLIKSNQFKLPNRKKPITDIDIEAIIIDATESPIQRPQKKTEALLLREEKATHH
jgi:hypothetical protein